MIVDYNFLMREKRQRKVHYRVAKFEHHLEQELNNTDDFLCKLSLEEMVTAALMTLKEEKKPIERKIDLYGYKQELSLVDGKMSQLNQCCVSALISYRIGDCVPAIGLDSNGRRIISEHVRTEQGELLDPAQEIIFIAISGNNIAYYSDLHSADKKLNEFLIWLLEQGHILKNNISMHLESRVSRSLREKIQKHGIKRIHLNDSTAMKVSISGGLLDDMKRVILDRLSRCNEPIVCDGLLQGRKAALESCSFQLTISTGRGNTGIKQEALQYYCLQLSDAELENFKIELDNGEVYSHGDIVTSGSVCIEYDRGVISQYSALCAISRWLKDTES